MPEKKKQVQAYLSKKSLDRVEEIQEAFKKMNIELSESGAVNALIERLCDMEEA